MALYPLADFIVPIARDGDEEVAAGLLNRATETRADVIASLRYLVDHISVFGMPSARRKWRRGLALAARKNGIELADIGLTEADLRGSRRVNRTMDCTSRRFDHWKQRLWRRKLTHRLRLSRCLIRKTRSSYFKWEPILTRVANSLDLADVDRLATKFETGYRGLLPWRSWQSVPHNSGIYPRRGLSA